MEPCGTPDVTSYQSEFLPFITTRCKRSAKYDWNQQNILFSIPNLLRNFKRRSSCGTESKARRKSVYITWVWDLRSKHLETKSVKCSKLVAHDFDFRKPCWSSLISRLIWIRKERLIKPSNTLAIIGCSAIARYPVTSFLKWFLS